MRAYHDSFATRIRILDPPQEKWIRIRVSKKIVTNSHKNQPKLFTIPLQETNFLSNTQE